MIHIVTKNVNSKKEEYCADDCINEKIAQKLGYSETQNDAQKTVEFANLIVVLNSKAGKRILLSWGAKSIKKFCRDCWLESCAEEGYLEDGIQV